MNMLLYIIASNSHLDSFRNSSIHNLNRHTKHIHMIDYCIWIGYCIFAIDKIHINIYAVKPSSLMHIYLRSFWMSLEVNINLIHTHIHTHTYMGLVAKAMTIKPEQTRNMNHSHSFFLFVSIDIVRRTCNCCFLQLQSWLIVLRLRHHITETFWMFIMACWMNESKQICLLVVFDHLYSELCIWYSHSFCFVCCFDARMKDEIYRYIH